MTDLMKMENVLQASPIQSVDSFRAQEEVKASIAVAKRFPRNEIDSQVAIINSCKRLTLAEVAMYSYPRGGQRIVGPSIHLAKALAQKWGNIQYGVRIIGENNGESICEAYCWDMENNVRTSKVFMVKHEIKLKTGQIKKLDDPRDIYEHVANYGARRLRACILDCIPGDVVEAAVKQCKETLEKSDGVPLKDRIAKMIYAFQEMGVTKEMIEKRVGHIIDALIPTELVSLQNIYLSLRDGMSKREDWFDLQSVNTENQKATEDLNKKVLDGDKAGKENKK